MDRDNRVVVLIDMDCFYCQVEEKLNPELQGKPIAVVQYNPWKGGGIIAVNYVARDRGVTRHMRGDEAKEKCPEIELPSVPCLRGKADISKYREAGKEVARVLQKFTTLLERASIDEAYLDITEAVNKRLKSTSIHSITEECIPNTFALGYDSISGFVSDVHTYASDNIEFDHEHSQQLLVGALIVSEIRAAVYSETGYRCSGGIAHNKILAKLVCGMNKPNKQTVLPKHCVNILYKSLLVKKVKHLGGKFGDSVCASLKISKMAELQRFTERELQAKFDEKNGTWLYNIARGVDLEPVQARFNPKSIGCCKQFKGKNALTDLESLKKWLKDLGDEIEDRLEKDALENNRTPKQMVVSFSTQLPDGRDTSSSRSYNFADEDLCGEVFTAKALELVLDSIESGQHKADEKNRKLQMPIKFLGVSVGKFEDNAESKKTKKINDFFSAGTSKTNTNKENNTEKINTKSDDKKTANKVKSNTDKEYILKKFFQATYNVKETRKSNETLALVKTEAEPVISKKETIESTLVEQESFFARILNQGKLSNNTKIDKINEDTRPTTPICKVVECGDNSNDSDYSSSTINQEINKSISLFEDDPQDVARVSNIRNLLGTSMKIDKITGKDSESGETSKTHSPKQTETTESKTRLPKETEAVSTKTPSPKPAETIISITPSPKRAETIECEQCKKQIPIQHIEMHADYHLALKLREEERQIFRKEKELVKASTNMPKPETKESTKSEANNSIAGFLVRLNDTVTTELCNICSKRIAIDKLPEHSDFHEAQKLSRELNKRPTPSNYAQNSVKRKRKSISPEKKTKMQCKPIYSFFGK